MEICEELKQITGKESEPVSLTCCNTNVHVSGLETVEPGEKMFCGNCGELVAYDGTQYNPATEAQLQDITPEDLQELRGVYEKNLYKSLLISMIRTGFSQEKATIMIKDAIDKGWPVERIMSDVEGAKEALGWCLGREGEPVPEGYKRADEKPDWDTLLDRYNSEIIKPFRIELLDLTKKLLIDSMPLLAEIEETDIDADATLETFYARTLLDLVARVARPDIALEQFKEALEKANDDISVTTQTENKRGKRPDR